MTPDECAAKKRSAGEAIFNLGRSVQFLSRAGLVPLELDHLHKSYQTALPGQDHPFEPQPNDGSWVTDGSDPWYGLRMRVDDFYVLLELLTGKPVQKGSEVEKDHINSIVEDDNVKLGYSQFNELLLLANKDRVERPFFEYFFCHGNGSTCQIQDLKKGVDRFRVKAMLRFGNFVYAYRKLSRLLTPNALQSALGTFAKTDQELLEAFRARHSATLFPETISKDETHYVGYVTSQDAAFDFKRIKLLREALSAANWDQSKRTLTEICNEGLRTEMVNRFDRLKEKCPNMATAEKIVQSALEVLGAEVQKVKDTQRKAKRNNNIYLAWDHMDVYFATSMRKRSEYEEFSTFVQQLLKHSELRTLAKHLRYFDPTQSFEDDRIDKGLIEALMLKRARCTVYSVQDVDTLGKDSELAATLAQGKAVIAYAPKIDVKAVAKRLENEYPALLKRTLYFVLYADESMSSRLTRRERELLISFPAELDKFESAQPLPCKTWVQPDLLRKFRKENSRTLQTICRVVAKALATIYDKRANMLVKTHPLGLQVNLRTGVANGLLVARDISTCAKLLKGVLLNSIDLDVVQDEKEGYWFLKERQTGSVYRVVTGNRKLTNCFWNFYEERTSAE